MIRRALHGQGRGIIILDMGSGMASRGRRYLMLAPFVLAAALAVACGGGDDGDGAGDRRLVLAGHPDHVDAARPLVAGLHATFDDAPDEDDALVVVVSAEDGPMPATREVIEALAGQETGALAILLTGTAQTDDPELQALVVQETIDLMRQNDLPADTSTPVIRDTDPNLQLTLRGLTVTP